MWTSQEDEIVRKAVMKYGTNQWNRVASLLRRHNAAECRQRWVDFLDPRIRHSNWTPQEDSLLTRLAAEMPNMWRSIGSQLGRSGDASYARFVELSSGTSRPTNTLDEEPGDSDEQEFVAANARLTSSKGRKALRKQRERVESEQKFLDAVRDHRATGKRLNENAFSRPVIETSENRNRIEVARRVRKVRQRRPKLVLSPVVAPPVKPVTMPASEVQKLLNQLPPPRRG